jgi:hypothetical protein
MRLSMTPLLLHQYLNTEPGSVEIPRLHVSGSSQIAIEMTRDLGLEIGNSDNFTGSGSEYRREYSRLYGRVRHPAPPVPFVPAAVDILGALDPLEGDCLAPLARRPVRTNFGVLRVCWAMAFVFFISVFLAVLS